MAPEVSTLATALASATRGGEPLPAFCFGPSGAGKTVSARYVCRQLKREGVETVSPAPATELVAIGG